LDGEVFQYIFFSKSRESEQLAAKQRKFEKELDAGLKLLKKSRREKISVNMFLLKVGSFSGELFRKRLLRF
jgi:hypothetical protein